MPPSRQPQRNFLKRVSPRLLGGIGIAIVGIVVVLFLLSQPRGTDPNVAVVLTQNAQLSGTLQAVQSVPTQPPVIIVQPTQPPFIITATPVPQLVQPTVANNPVTEPQAYTQVLQSASQDGTVFSCPVTGEYTITIQSGAYSPFANGSGGKWRTFFTVYHNENVVFAKNQYGVVAPAAGANETIGIGNMELAGQSKDQAELTGRGGTVVTTCKQGEYLRFVAADEKGAYKDNFGTVTIELSVMGSRMTKP